MNTTTRPPIHLTLLHTNDIHGRVEQLARIATLVHKIRHEIETAGGFCFYLDCGDCEDTTNLDSAVTKGGSSEAILAAAGCDQAALGNAIPIRYGAQAIENLAVNFSKPLLCANLLDQNENPLPGLISHIVEDIGGIQIAFIGITDPLTVYQSIFHWKPVDPAKILPKIIGQVKQQGIHFVVVLSHCGSKADIELAQKVEGIDLIIGGHDHRFIDPPIRINETIIAQAGNYAEALGRLDFEFDPNSRRVLNFTGQLINVSEDVSQDRKTIQTIQSETNRVNTLMQTIVGELNTGLDCSEESECAAGNLLADALRSRIKDAQLAFVVAGHWNNGLQQGKITQKEIFSAIRSAANPARVVLSGAQIKQFLVNALKPENFLRKPHSLRGRAFGWPHVSGMTVFVNQDDPEKMEIMVQGKTIQEEDRFIVAATDMEFSDMLNYLPIENDQIEFEIPTIMAEVIEAYIKDHSPLGNFGEKRIQFLN